MQPYARYEPRRTELLGIEQHAGYRLKVYSISFDDSPIIRGEFDGAWAWANSTLPVTAIADGRPGVGFVIMHKGRSGHYFILCWWDRENELPTRVFIREDSVWRMARGSESFCVWDLQVISRERDAYVRTLLAEQSAEDYLRA